MNLCVWSYIFIFSKIYILWNSGYKKLNLYPTLTDSVPTFWRQILHVFILTEKSVLINAHVVVKVSVIKVN